MSRIVAAVCVLVGLAAHTKPRQPTPQAPLPDVHKLGPQMGTRAPDFSSVDQKGRSRTADLAKNGLGLAAISYDAVPILADFSKRRGTTFPLLSDPGSATIKRYRILNTTVPEANQQSYGIRFP
jgi:peroxiredoxin